RPSTSPTPASRPGCWSNSALPAACSPPARPTSTAPRTASSRASWRSTPTAWSPTSGRSADPPSSAPCKPAQLPESKRESLQSELLGHVQRQAQARVLHELDGSAQAQLRGGTVLEQARTAVDRVDQLRDAFADAQQIPQPQLGQGQPQVQRAS